MSQSDSKAKYQSLIAECDQLIKSGQMGVVAHKISQLNLNSIPRPARLELANICRRVDMIGHGLRLLQPLVRHEKKAAEPATPLEICEYSSLLSRNGSTMEAMGFLKDTLSDSIPKSYLYLAHCHISNWDYEMAVPLLLKYLELEKEEYSKLVAQMNLVPAYLITSQWTEAEKILSELIPAATSSGAQRLLGNCLGFQGRLRFGQGDFAGARESFEKAIEIFGQVSIFDRLFIQKWSAVLSAFENKSTQPLIEFRKEALIREDWESVREADLYALKIDFDQKAYDHLRFGTPMPGYRRRIESELAGRTSSASYVYGSDVGICFDLDRGVLDPGGEINPGKKVHQLLAALVKDFYAPRKIGALFFDIYPNEYFDPVSSPMKLSQIIKRTRAWLKERQIPAQIILEGGTVRLSIHGEFGVRLALEPLKLETFAIQWQELKSKFPIGTSFSALEACKFLNQSRTNFHRIADYAIELGELQRSGTGKSTRYCRPLKKRTAAKKVA